MSCLQRDLLPSVRERSAKTEVMSIEEEHHHHSPLVSILEKRERERGDEP